MLCKSNNPAGGPRGGFTLVEILMVVIMLGILAAITLPKFADATHTARENTMRDDLRFLRTQVVVFKAQHRESAPGYPGGNPGAAPSQAEFVSQMTGYSSDTCVVGAQSAVNKYGPYLSKMPQNPINGLDTVLIVGNGQAMPPGGMPDNSTGWIYKPETLEIMANLPGTGSDGVRYIDY